LKKNFCSQEIRGEEKLFVDQLLVELEIAGLDSLELLEAAVLQIHRELPEADLATWKDALSQRFPSLKETLEMENPLDFDLAIKLLIFHCVQFVV
jgi:hypothetical protein